LFDIDLAVQAQVAGELDGLTGIVEIHRGSGIEDEIVLPSHKVKINVAVVLGSHIDQGHH
jgi:hypothetical protein